MSARQPERSAVLTEDMRRVVREQRLGFVATVCPDGTPSLSPKGTTAVWGDEHLIFADIRSPGTVANLQANPAVEVNVVDPIARKGYRFKGEAAVLTEGPVFDEILTFYENGAAPVRDARSRIRSAILVKVERAPPLVSPSYDLGLTEEAICAVWWDHHAGLRAGVRDDTVPPSRAQRVPSPNEPDRRETPRGRLTPGELRVRDGRADDAQHIAEVHVDGWRWGYRGLVPDGVLDGLSVDEFARLWGERLASLPEDLFLV